MSGYTQGQHLADHPIIARHWFGVDVIADLRRQRHVRKLHRLGPRALDALLVEIGAERSIMTIVERKIAKYAALDANALEITGGDRFPPAPIYEVGHGGSV